MSVQLAFDLEAPTVSEPLGDLTLNRAFVQSMRTSAAHRAECMKGCQLEPPIRCAKGYRLRQAQHEVYGAVMATVDPSTIAAIRARVDEWVRRQRARGPLWWNTP